MREEQNETFQEFTYPSPAFNLYFFQGPSSWMLYVHPLKFSSAPFLTITFKKSFSWNRNSGKVS